MKSWLDHDAPKFRRHKSGVTITTPFVTHFIPWSVWDWIKLAMGDEQQVPSSSGWNDPPSDDALTPTGEQTAREAWASPEDAAILDAHIAAAARREEARAEESQRRHEGVQEREPVRFGTMQRGRLFERMGMVVRPAVTSRLPEVLVGALEDEVVSRPELAGPVDAPAPASDSGVLDDVLHVPSVEDCLDRWTCCVHSPPDDK